MLKIILSWLENSVALLSCSSELWLGSGGIARDSSIIFSCKPCTAWYLLSISSLQGPFIKRHIIKKANGQSYGARDVKVGENVEIYGKIIHIVDADPFTRAYLADLGDPLKDAEPMPIDPVESRKITALLEKGRSKFCFPLYPYFRLQIKFRHNPCHVLVIRKWLIVLPTVAFEFKPSFLRFISQIMRVNRRIKHCMIFVNWDFQF